MGNYRAPNYVNDSKARARRVSREEYYRRCEAAGIPDKSMDNVDTGGGGEKKYGGTPGDWGRDECQKK